MKVAFLTKVFPNISETFVRDQVIGLHDRQNEILIFAYPNPKDISIALKGYDQYKLQDKIVSLHTNTPKNKHRRLIEAIKLIYKHWRSNKKQILNCLNLKKFGKQAISLQTLFQIKPFLGKEIDVLVCHFGPNGNYGAFLKKVGFNFKLITIFHGYDIRLGLQQGGGIYQELIQYGDAYLSIADYNKKALIKFGFPKSKIIDHPVGVSQSIIANQGEQVNRASDIFRILSVGRLVWEKGYEHALKAINLFVKNNPNIKVEYIVVGDGDKLDELNGLAYELQLHDVVSFVGSKPSEDVFRLMRNSDLFLLASLAEVTPVVLMEAQLHRLPIVATNVGGVSEIVLDKQSGFLSEPKDYNSLATNIEAIFDLSAKERLEMGTIGYNHIIKNYNIDILNDRLNDLIIRLVNRKGA